MLTCTEIGAKDQGLALDDGDGVDQDLGPLVRVNECGDDSRFRQSQPQGHIFRSGLQEQSHLISRFESLRNETVRHLIRIQFQLTKGPALVLVVKDDFIRMSSHVFAKDRDHIPGAAFEAKQEYPCPDQTEK